MILINIIEYYHHKAPLENMSFFVADINYKKLNSYLLLLLAFFATVSISISSIVSLLFFVSWLLSGNFQFKIEKIILSPITFFTILFLVYVLVNNFLTNSDFWNKTIEKQLYLLLLPILYSSEIENKFINKSKWGFLLGIFVNISISIVTFLFPENSLFKAGHYDQKLFLHGFLDHFDYSVFLCFSLILSFQLSKLNPIVHISMFIVFFCVLLNSYGRVGIIASVLFIPIIVLLFKNNNVNRLLLIIISLITIFLYCTFNPFSNRVSESVKSIRWIQNPPTINEKINLDAQYMAQQIDSIDVETFTNRILKDPIWLQEVKDKRPEYETSLGKRFLLLKNSFTLINKNLTTGYGLNSFEKVYNANYSHKNMEGLNYIIPHPHNNFVFIIFEMGLIGLMLTLLIFISQIRLYFMHSKKDYLQIIFPFFFLFIMCFDNYFLNHNTLIFFCLFSFILFPPNLKKSNKKPV